MAIDSKHPSYLKYHPDWIMCRDAYDGERAVKDKGVAYLPPTYGMEADGMRTPQDAGYKAYTSYKQRAVFPDFMALAVETAIGLMWSKPPTIELPAVMESMLEKATTRGEGLEQLLRRINEQQLVAGRLGLLADLPKIPDPANPLPYIAMYLAEDIINWDGGTREQVAIDSLNLVILCESEEERNNSFEWVHVDKFRVLILGDTVLNESTGNYKFGLFKGKDAVFNEALMDEPVVRGTPLKAIPFVFINSKDIVECPDNPPLLGLVRLCMTIYRTEADYRQSLFMQGQDTLVITGGGEETTRVGAGAAIQLPTGGDAKFIGVSSTGLPEQRMAVENDKKQAAVKSGQLIDTSSKDKESADALRTRMAAQTATLNQIALAGAEGLQTVLRTIATWIGADPEEVIITPNLDFVNDEMDGKTLIDLMTAKTLGAPISRETIHRRMQDRSLTELSYEDEMALIADEEPILDNVTEDQTNPNNNGA